MHYLSISAWIFAFLLFLVALLFLYPADFVIGLSVIALPIMIGVQAIVILKASQPKRPADHRWYDHHIQ